MHLIRRDADTGIADAPLYGLRAIHAYRNHLHPDRSILGEFAGVAQQVVEALPELHHVHMHGGKRGGAVHYELVAIRPR